MSKGSTELLKRLRDAYPKRLAQHRTILRNAFANHGGAEVDAVGDSFFVVFPRARDAALGAVEAQRALAEHPWPPDGEVKVRMALHTGEAQLEDGRYHGLGVHRAARIMAAAHGGEILVSRATCSVLEDEDLPGLTLRDLGEFRLKDIDRPERLHRLEGEGLTADLPPPRAEAVSPPRSSRLRRRTLAGGALAGVIAAAVAVPLFAIGGDSGERVTRADALPGDAVGIFDPQTSAVVGAVEGVPGAAQIAEGAGALWVTSPHNDTVARIDPDAESVRQTIKVGSDPAGVAVGGGAVWVANRLGRTVSRIDPGTNEIVQTITVGNKPSGIAFGNGAVWVGTLDDRTLVGIDPTSGDVLDRIDTGAAGAAVAVGGGSVWVTDAAGSTVARVDPSSREVLDRIGVGNGPRSLAYGMGALWVGNDADGTVSRVDPSTGVITATTRVGAGPAGIAVTEGSVWVSAGAGRTLTELDPETGQVRRTIATSHRPGGIVASGDRLWLAVQDAGAIHRGGRLVVGVPVSNLNLVSIDPARTYDQAAWSVLSATHDGLVAFRRVGGGGGSELVPDLATALPRPTDAGRRYVFRLRSGIQFADGTPLRAEDVRRSLERLFRVGVGVTPGPGYYAAIRGASACLKTPERCDLGPGVQIDDAAGTVTIRLVRPDPELLYKLALPFAMIVPASTPMRPLDRGPVTGTGPYRVASFRPRHELRLVRNPSFRQWSAAAQPDGFPDEILYRLEERPLTASATLTARGVFDASVLEPRPEQLEQLATRYASQIHVVPKPETRYLALNTRIRRSTTFACGGR